MGKSGRCTSGEHESAHYQSIDDNWDNPHRLAGFHTELLFKPMWDAADVLMTRQIEVG